MHFERLPNSVQALYSELLDLLEGASAERESLGVSPGTFVSKEIHGARYWYSQVAVGAERKQRYLGRETPELLRWMARAKDSKGELSSDDALRERLVAMAIEGGAQREETASGRVLDLLANLGIFRRGGILVGTHAVQAYGNLLGVRFADRHVRTADVDIAHDLAIAFALRDEGNLEVERTLIEAGLGFLAVPGLDPREPSTSFKIRGRDLRVDFLAPARSSRATAPIVVPGLGVSAQPLTFLDYLIEDPIPAALLRGAGILVTVPTPARFALHKLWLARKRPAAQQVRALKDRRQAIALLQLLVEDRPQDLRAAWRALSERTSARKLIAIELSGLDEPLRSSLKAIDLPSHPQ